MELKALRVKNSTTQFGDFVPRYFAVAVCCLLVAAGTSSYAFAWFQDASSNTESKTAANDDPQDSFAAAKELITEEEETNFKRILSKYRGALRSGNTGTQETNFIKEGAKINVLRLSLKKNREEIRKMVDEVIRDIELHGKGASKELMLAEVHKQAIKLLDNSLPVRINAAILLRSLNTEKEKIDGTAQKVARPYQPVATTFIDILKDKSQHQAVKIQAVKGLERICEDGSPGPKVDIRYKMAQAIIDELKNPQLHPWYQRTCARALPKTDIVYNTNKQPFAVQILAEILVDTKRNWHVRSQAAKSLGRLKLDGQLNVELLAFEITYFCLQMSVAYNQNLNNPIWRHSFFDVYLAFQPEDEIEKGNGAGLLSQTQRLAQFKAFTKSAYDENLKLVNSVFSAQNNRPIPRATQQEVNSWVKQNQPANFSVMQGMPSLRPKQEGAVSDSN